MGGTDEQESIRTIHEAIDHGVTFLDTAPAYGQGRSEEIVGRALAEHPKGGQIAVATKAGLDWTSGGLKRNSRPERLRQERETTEQQNRALEDLAGRRKALAEWLGSILAEARAEQRAIESELASVLAGDRGPDAQE